MRRRAQPYIRKFLGQRLRSLRQQRGLSQAGLGSLAGLSAKFIGEVERGVKSISVDSLYAIAVALRIPLSDLTDLPTTGRRAPAVDAQKIFALVSARNRPKDIRRAYEILRALFAKSS